jgi:hypothetical protein
LQWRSNEPDWQDGLTPETFAGHIKFANCILANRFIDAVWHVAITARWPWEILLPHTNVIADEARLELMARILLADEAFVNAPKETVGPLLTSRLLKEMLTILEDKTRAMPTTFHRYESGTTDTNGALLAKVFLRFIYSKHTDSEAKAWFRTARVGWRLVTLAIVCAKHGRDRRAERFFKQHVKWGRRYRFVKERIRV